MEARKSQRTKTVPVEKNTTSTDLGPKAGSTQKEVESDATRHESTTAPVAGSSKEFDSQLDRLLEIRLQERIREAESHTDWNSGPNDHYMSDTGSEEEVQVAYDSDSSELSVHTKPKKTIHKDKIKKSKPVDSESEVTVSEGDTHLKAKKRRARLVVRKGKKSKKRSKKSDSSRSSGSDNSSSTGTDSDTKYEGPYGARCKKNIKKCREKPGKRARVCTTMRRSVEGHFNTFKPVEVIQRGIEKFTGIKGLPDSWIRDLDTEVQISEDKKKYEHVLFTIQKGVLAALTAMIPVANRMMEQIKFTSLTADMDEAVELLAATSTFINFRRFENVFKSVTTEAGKEVTRSKKVTDNNGKEYTLFLPPHPIKGKVWDKTKMFGGQVTHLFKQVESGNKCGKQFGHKRKVEDSGKGPARRQFTGRSRRPGFRGNRSQFNFHTRGRGLRGQSYGWNDSNRASGFRQNPSVTQGKSPGFQRTPAQK